MTGDYITLCSLVSIALLWAYLFWLYGDFRTDQFRQQMFALRDELFDEAASGKISFEDTAYGVLRVTTNGFIRFAHHLSIAHLLASSFWVMRNGDAVPKMSKSFASSIADISGDKRKIYISYHNRMQRLVIRQIILRSPLLFATIAIPAGAYVFAAVILDKTMAMLESTLEKMDEIAYVAATPSE